MREVLHIQPVVFGVGEQPAEQGFRPTAQRVFSDSEFQASYSIVKDPTSHALVQLGAGASPLRVALRTGRRLWAGWVGVKDR